MKMEGVPGAPLDPPMFTVSPTQYVWFGWPGAVAVFFVSNKFRDSVCNIKMGSGLILGEDLAARK